MFRVFHIQWNGVIHFCYWVFWRGLCNGILSDWKIDHMQKLHPKEFDIPTYHFGVHKIFRISSSKVMFMVENILRHGLGPFNYYYPQWNLLNSLLNVQNRDCMKMLQSQEVDVSTYHCWVSKVVVSSYSKVIIMVHHKWRHLVGTSHYCSPQWFLSNAFSNDPNREHMQKLWPTEFDVPNYQFGVQKAITFHIIV